MDGSRSRSHSLSHDRRPRDYTRDPGYHRYPSKHNTTAESRLTAPIPLYPMHSCTRSSCNENEERSPHFDRPVVSSHRSSNSTTSSPHKPFKSYSISEILKPSEPARKDANNNRATSSQSDLFFHREAAPLPRESSTFWNYESGTSSPDGSSSTCCECMSALRYPCPAPCRTWPFPLNTEHEALSCGAYGSAGMSAYFFCLYLCVVICFSSCILPVSFLKVLTYFFCLYLCVIICFSSCILPKSWHIISIYKLLISMVLSFPKLLCYPQTTGIPFPSVSVQYFFSRTRMNNL